MTLSLRLIVILFFIVQSVVFAQNKTIDSLKLALKNAKHDTNRCAILEQLIEIENDHSIWSIYNYELLNISLKNSRKSNFNENEKNNFKEYYSIAINNLGYLEQIKGKMQNALKFYLKSEKLYREIFNKNGTANALNNIGFVHFNLGNIELALNFYKKSLELREEINDKKGISESLNNIGFLFENKGNISGALDYYRRSLKICLEEKDDKGIANLLNNIGSIYYKQGDTKKALNYYQKSLKLEKEKNNYQGIATSLNNIGIIYHFKGDPFLQNPDEESKKMGLQKALNYYLESLKIRDKIGDKIGLAYSLNNIGVIYSTFGDPSITDSKKKSLEIGRHKSLDFFDRSLKLRIKSGDKHGISSSLINIAGVYCHQKKYTKALKLALESMQISKELGYPENISDAAHLLKIIYSQLGNYRLALENYALYFKMRDSLNNIETQKATITQQTKYEYDKQKIIEDEKHASELKIQSEKAQADKKRQNIIIIGVSIVLLLVAFFSVILYNRFKTTHKQKLIIEKKELETLDQKQLIEEKQKEITDSINYAQKIQEAYMPPVGALQYCFKNSFLFFQPKDVVSGDFYYINNPLDENGNRIDEVYLAAADCTGHGVPGSIMSIICCNALNEAILTKKIRDTGKILDESREIIIRNLKSKNGSDRKDGMDICLLRINKKTNEVQFSGANNPFWFVSNNNLEEIKGNKQPVGLYENMSPFDTHTITMPAPSQLFLFTDGYADQFGGPRGKKYKYTQLKEFLLSNSELSMQEQYEKLKTEFESWKGDLEQVDDVCIISIKI